MLNRRTPMPRGKGFQRKAGSFEISKNRKFMAACPPAEIEAACGLADDEGPIDHHQVATLKPLRRGTYTAPQLFVTAPKQPRAENAYLLSMARGKPCLIRSPICNYDPETTVACHGGGVASGKGLAYKVSDALTCWGCSACNHYTDAYAGATRQQKRDAFALGHLAQVCEWRAIAGSAAAPIKDRLAAQWALDHLNATPVGQLETP